MVNTYTMKKTITLEQLKKVLKESVTPEDPDYEMKRELGEKHLKDATLCMSDAIAHLKFTMERLPHGEEYEEVLDKMKKAKFTLDDMYIGGVRESKKKAIKEASVNPTIIKGIILALKKLDRQYGFSESQVTDDEIYVEHECEEGEDPDLIHDEIEDAINAIPQVRKLKEALSGYIVNVYVY